METIVREVEELVSEQDLSSISIYARFMLQNIGYSFYNKKNKKELDKWELFSIIEKQPGNVVHNLNLIYLNKDCLYGRKKKCQ
jgi:hypothetical protein